MKRPDIESILDFAVRALASKDESLCVIDRRVPELCSYALELERELERARSDGEALRG